MNSSIVYIVDDEPEICNSLLRLMKSAGLFAQAFTSAEAFLDEYRPGIAGCLILDCRLTGMSGLDLQERLKALAFELPIILISGDVSVPDTVKAIKSGAVDVLEKPFNNDLLLEHVRRCLAPREESPFRRDYLQRVNTLTIREREVMRGLIDGKKTVQIAHELSISPKTVEKHRVKVFNKLNVDSTVELVRMELTLN